MSIIICPNCTVVFADPNAELLVALLEFHGMFREAAVKEADNEMPPEAWNRLQAWQRADALIEHQPLRCEVCEEEYDLIGASLLNSPDPKRFCSSGCHSLAVTP